MDRFLFWRLKTEPAEKVCSKGGYEYFNLTINGYLLTFAKNRYRPNGLRLYILGEELAKCLGFANYADMRLRKRMQYSRGMLSVEALERHF